MIELAIPSRPLEIFTGSGSGLVSTTDSRSVRAGTRRRTRTMSLSPTVMGHKNPLTTTRYLHPSLHKAKELIDRRNEQAQETLRHTEEIEEVPTGS